MSIAFVDEGVEITHQDLGGKIRGGDATMSGAHGTRIAGCATASTNNGIGVAGLGWETRITPFNRFDGTDAASEVVRLLTEYH